MFERAWDRRQPDMNINHGCSVSWRGGLVHKGPCIKGRPHELLVKAWRGRQLNTKFRSATLTGDPKRRKKLFSNSISTITALVSMWLERDPSAFLLNCFPPPLCQRQSNSMFYTLLTLSYCSGLNILLFDKPACFSKSVTTLVRWFQMLALTTPILSTWHINVHSLN